MNRTARSLGGCAPPLSGARPPGYPLASHSSPRLVTCLDTTPVYWPAGLTLACSLQRGDLGRGERQPSTLRDIGQSLLGGDNAVRRNFPFCSRTGAAGTRPPPGARSPRGGPILPIVPINNTKAQTSGAAPRVPPQCSIARAARSNSRSPPAWTEPQARLAPELPCRPECARISSMLARERPRPVDSPGGEHDERSGP